MVAMGHPHDHPAPATSSFVPGRVFGYPAAESPQTIIDNEHLRLLRIGFFISAGQSAFLIPIGLVYAGMGLMFSHLPSGSGPPPPASMTWIFGIFGTVFAGVAALSALLKLLTAIKLKQRRSRVLCMVTAAFTCLEMPYGTALGVMAFAVLGRASVQEQFDRQALEPG
jgi:hypothetical protein